LRGAARGTPRRGLYSGTSRCLSFGHTSLGGRERRILPNMLKLGEVAPDFAIGNTSLYRLLEERSVLVFFFPKAFTPG
jgi:hypothetical protein